MSNTHTNPGAALARDIEEAELDLKGWAGRNGHSYNDEEPGTGCVSYCPACHDEARREIER